MATIGIAGSSFGRQVYRIQLSIDCHLRPGTAIARIGPGVIQPGVIAILTGLGNSVKNPEPIAGSRIVAANMAFWFLSASWHSSSSKRRADNDNAIGYNRRGMKPYFTCYEIQFLIKLLFQVYNAIKPKILDGSPTRRIQRNHLIARCHINDSSLVAAIIPPC